MKNSTRVVLLSILLLTGIVKLSAQSVGLLLDSYVTDRWYKDQKHLADRVRELGGEISIEVAYGDPSEQVRQCKALLSQGVKVMVALPVNSDKAKEIAALCKQANVPLIAYDRLILSNDVSVYISYNNEKVGELQAQYALAKKPSGNYLMVHGPTSDNNSLLLRKGQLTVLRSAIESKRITVLENMVMEDWGELGSLMKVDSFFSHRTEKPDVILAANDALAAGSIQALPKDLVGRVLITGQDADLVGIQNIIDGKQAMTVYKPIKPLAYLAAEVAIDLAKGKKIKNKTKLVNGEITVDAILLTPISVDVTNYNQTVIKDGHILLTDLKEKK